MGEHSEDLGNASVRNPDLGPVHDVVTSVFREDGARADRLQTSTCRQWVGRSEEVNRAYTGVGTTARFSQAERSEVFARRQTGQVLFFLLGRSKQENAFEADRL